MEVRKASAVPPVDAGSGKDATDHGPPAAGVGGFVSKRPKRRPRAGISDVAFIMGIPETELTERVQQALTLIMNEFDRQRDELEHYREYSAFLESVADRHGFLPALNRRALLRELAGVLARAEQSETTSVFLYFHIHGMGLLRRRRGHAAAEAALSDAVAGVRACLRASDVVGSMDGNDFGVILAATEAGAARDKAAELTTLLDEKIFPGHGTDLKAICGFHLIAAEESVESAIEAADRDMRGQARERDDGGPGGGSPS